MLGPVLAGLLEVAGFVARVEPAEPRTRPDRGLRQYLSRDLAYSARFLDHGILQVSGAGGWPHAYAVRLHVGLLDHVTLGLQARWLPFERAPSLSPEFGVAVVRVRWLEWGVLHRQVFDPRPDADEDAGGPSWRRRDHWLLSSLSLSNKWLTGGFDFGVVRSPDPDSSRSTVRWRLGGGLHLRAGTRRWGMTASLLAPRPMAELAFDLRFGLFEMRNRGGWRPAGVLFSTDRRVPRWR